MDDIVNGIIEAFQLIITMDHEVMEIAQRSLTVSMEATIIAALIAIPLGAVIYYFSFREKRIGIGTIQTLYALPTVLVGLLVFCWSPMPGRSECFGCCTRRTRWCLHRYF